MNIVEFKRKPEPTLFGVKVIWKDGKETILDADMFGDSDAIANYIAVVEMEADELKYLINKDSIKMICFNEVLNNPVEDSTEGC